MIKATEIKRRITDATCGRKMASVTRVGMAGHLVNVLTFPEEVVFYAGLWPCSGPESLISLLSLHHRQEGLLLLDV